MSLSGKKIGIAFTGSFCTYARIFEALEALQKEGAVIQTIFSDSAQSIDSRFGTAESFLKRAEEITGIPPILTIKDAEPIGPKSLLDLLVIFPCTGNTLAKLANGITDTPVLMAAKASTNDALGLNMKNIGLLINAKNIFFIPFGQDNPIKKPTSLISHPELLLPSIESALNKQQIQPLIKAW